MPVEDKLIPAECRVRTVLEKLALVVVGIVQEIEGTEFIFIPPDSDLTATKKIYFELLPSEVNVESLASTQRTWGPLAIDLIGLIRHEDPLVGVDFMWEIIRTLLTPEAVSACGDAFGTSDGFSIETISNADVTPANRKTGGASAYSQVRMRLNITMGADQTD